MGENFEHILSIALGVIGLSMGLCLLLLKIPPVKELQNYRSACRILGIGYLVVSPLMCIYHAGGDWHFTQIVILTIAPLLALAFTSTFITLIDVRFSLKQIAWRELLPIITLSACTFITYYWCSFRIHMIVFILFVVYYVYLLIRYTLAFLKACRRYEQQEDNYYSVPSTNLLSWVKQCFYFALLVGVLALAAVWISPLLFSVFKLLIIPFYVYSSVQLISYSFRFHYRAPVLLSVKEKEGMLWAEAGKNPVVYQELEERIARWVEEKQFIHSAPTIEELAEELNTNRTYLSFYINSCEKKTFREWIHSLRIEEAKRLLLEYDTLPIGQIGVMVGYSDRSNFSRQFVKYVGQSPKEWRDNQ